MGRAHAKELSRSYAKGVIKVSSKFKAEDFKGIALSEEDFKEKKVIFSDIRAKAYYAWTAGVAISRFLSELKEGKIIARKCNKCGRVLIPPRMFCELCYRPTDEWVYVKDTGRVNTFSIAWIGVNASRLKEPLIPAVIEIDGASPGMGIYHMLGEVDPAEVRIGMNVQAVWKPKEERKGCITDIKYFKPIK